MKFIVLICCVILLFACKRKKPTTWNTNIVAPLVKSSLTIDNILPDRVLNTNTDSSININYSYTIDALNEENVVNIDNDTLSQYINFPFPNSVQFNAGAQVVNSTEPSSFQYGNARITKMKVNKGIVEVLIRNDIESDVITTFSILRSADENGNPFSQTIRIPAATNGVSGVYQQDFVLTNFTFDLTEDGTHYNKIVTSTSATLDPNGNGASISNQDSLTIQYILKDLAPNYLTGYLGNELITQTNQESNFDIFNRITSGAIDIDDVAVNLTVSNYVGADMQLELLSLDAINSNTSSTISLAHPLINQQLNFTRASRNWRGITPSVQSFSLTPLNSNIDDMIENLPNKFGYGFKLQMNPLGNVSNGHDFLYFNNTVELGLAVNMPLSFIATNLVLVDTTTLDINADDNPVTNGFFTLFVENGFPFDADLQVYILDNNNQVIDSLIDNTYIAAGTIDAQNKVTTPSNNTLTTTISSSKMQLLEQNNKVVISSKFNTAGANHVTLYDHYQLNLKLIGDFNYEATIN